jgi:hypothetical protein
MVLPVIRGVIDRRLLINFRVEPEVLQALLPRPFRPQVVSGHGIAGVCLIRFRGLRPNGWPAALGLSSENAAYRVAVEWDDGRDTHGGVYILRRQTNSRWNAWAGGRVFPGCHERARFISHESGERLRVEVIDAAGGVDVQVAARVASGWPAESAFASLDAASQFFRAGSRGYSPGRSEGRLEGLELRCRDWQVTPLEMETARARFFEDAAMFPAGSVALDCGLLMRGVEHQWQSLPALGERTE